MAERDSVWRTSEDVQVLDNALKDNPAVPDGTRRRMVQRASLGLLGAGLFLAGCGGSGNGSGSAMGSGGAATTSNPGANGSAEDIKTIIDTAITAEALAVTYLSAVIQMADKQKGTAVEPFVDVLKAANTEEYDHYKVLKGLGAKPIATKFWAPNDFFGDNLKNVFATLEVAETLFVNAYLIGQTTFAKAGKADLTRYAGEIGGVEAEHLALARYAQDKLPNNLGFMDYSITSIDGIVKALQDAGVGFGEKGSKPGQFVEFPGKPPAGTTLDQVTSEKPE